LSATTSIEWTDRSWNPVRGCALVSEGCRHCYAMNVAHRFSGAGQPYEGLTELGPAGPRWTGKVRLVEDALVEPLRWRKPQRIFVNSMSDLFHEDVPDAFLDRVFVTMLLSPHHTYQVLTKRPARMLAYCSDDASTGRVMRLAAELTDGLKGVTRSIEHEPDGLTGMMLPNVWLGVSAENQPALDERLPLLLRTPAAVRFLSLEPLLGGIDIAKHRPGANRLWVIVGGESGHGARACQVWWIRNIVKQCECAGVPVFVKQLGARAQERCGNCGHDIGRGVAGGFVDACGPSHAQLIAEMMRVRDSKGGDMTEWPEDLRVRQFPGVLVA
jgi:protein gp37